MTSSDKLQYTSQNLTASKRGPFMISNLPSIVPPSCLFQLFSLAGGPSPLSRASLMLGELVQHHPLSEPPLTTPSLSYPSHLQPSMCSFLL